jgi:hypothetical protein
MRFPLLLTSLLAISSLGLTLPRKEISPLQASAIQGGSVSYSFDSEGELNDFDLYSELARKPAVMDGSLYAWVMCEQKAVLKNYNLSSVILDTHIKTINPSGKIDCGLYLGGSGFTNNKDGATAWNVNVEHDVNKNVFALKLHRFSQGVWIGAAVERDNIPYRNNEVHLQVTVDSGVVAAYVNDNTTPTFSYYVGVASSTGLVGLRSYYAPDYFEDLTITAPQFTRDMTAFNQEYEADQKLDPTRYTDPTFAAMADLLTEIASTDLSQENQIDINEWTSRLASARERLQERRTYEELQTLIASYAGITNDNDQYTANSYASFAFTLGEAKKLVSTSSSKDISYWYAMLKSRGDALIAYSF